MLWIPGLFLLLLLAAAGFVLYRVYGSLPQVEGRLRVDGLRRPVQVYRDERGVPHIEAHDTGDLYLAQGLVTAQDRLWQMDLMRRLAAGRLSELFGPATVKLDTYFRTLRLRAVAETAADQCPPELRKLLEAYARGVNAVIAEAARSERLPVEFQLLRYRPEPWSLADTLSISRLLAYNLGMNFQQEAYRLQLYQLLQDEQLFEGVAPRYPEDGYITIQTGAPAACEAERRREEIPDEVRRCLLGLLEAVAPRAEAATGSNGWVVAGSLTRSGKPLLANDPHVEVQTPSLWYQSHLVLDAPEERLNVIGVTVPGVPGILAGHNEQIAWGITSSEADTQDLYLERRNPANPRQFEYQGAWEESVVHREVIRVKGGSDRVVEVLESRHGPILSDVLAAAAPPEGHALALRWTALSPSADLEAVMGLNRARNWQEFREALRTLHSPVLNFLFAAADGCIAFKTAGQVPIRSKGAGWFPVPGWTGEYEWTGQIRFDDLPELVNPECGYIVSANNRIADDGYRFHLTCDWNMPFRAGRIEQVLASGGPFTVEEMRRLQTDLYDPQADQLLPGLLHSLDPSGFTTREWAALALLKGWDRVSRPEEAAPFLFQLFLEEISSALFCRRMGSALYQQMSDKGIQLSEMLRQAFRGEESPWIKEAGGLGPLVTESFRSAVARGSRLQGPDPARWRWGDFHRIGTPHPIGKAVRPLGLLLNPKRHPVGGSNASPCLMSYHRETGAVIGAAPWRQVVDLGDLAENSWDINFPGQSGQFASRWYEDQSQAHVAGHLCPQHFLPRQYRRFAPLHLSPH